jgi:fumarate hydratase class I
MTVHDLPTAAPRHVSLLPLAPDETVYRKLTSEHVRVETALGEEVVVVAPEGLRLLAEQALVDINHLLRPSHLKQLRAIIDDPEASGNDRFVATDLLRNACVPRAGCCRCVRTPAPRSSSARRPRPC